MKPMYNMKRLILLAIIFILAGCAATGPKFQYATPPEKGKALVYIYRPGSFVLGGRDAYFYINEKNIVDLSSEGYTQIYLEPGTYSLKQKWPIDLIGFKDLELTIIVEANKTYYYRFYSSVNGDCPVGHICFAWSLGEIPEMEARPEITECRYQPSK